MRLVEQGRLALDEPVATWLPEFAAGGKADVTLRQVLTHTSGMRPLLELWKMDLSADARIEMPSIVRVTNSENSVTNTIAVAKMTTSMVEMPTFCITGKRWSRNAGPLNARDCPPKNMMVMFCRKIDTPSDVNSSETSGAPRSGR